MSAVASTLPIPAFLDTALEKAGAQGEPVTIVAWTSGFSDAFGDTVGAIVIRRSGALEETTLDRLTIDAPSTLRLAAQKRLAAPR